MTELLIDDSVHAAPPPGSAFERVPQAPLLPAAATEDELDWAENQGRSRREAARIDFSLVGIAVTLTAALVAGIVGLVRLF